MYSKKEEKVQLSLVAQYKKDYLMLVYKQQMDQILKETYFYFDSEDKVFAIDEEIDSNQFIFNISFAIECYFGVPAYFCKINFQKIQG
jgi:hypothetical protein